MQGSAQPVDDPSDRGRSLEEAELDSALQLLVERAQYITGATGTALALPQGEEMVCRASAGASAPAVGASLQVRSGLTGESIARRQLLRCDNAEADPRVNLETCRALGIASIVVLPLLRRNGEVRGLFELFSDHPYAFEERDLIALERMADLTATALDLAEQRQSSAAVTAARQGLARSAEIAPAEARSATVIPLHAESATNVVAKPATESTPQGKIAETDPAETKTIQHESTEIKTSEVGIASPATEASTVPAAMLRVQRCSSCGFPVSEGRTLCLDCEKKSDAKKSSQSHSPESKSSENKVSAKPVSAKPIEPITAANEAAGIDSQSAVASLATDPTPASSSAASEEEFIPAFLANSPPVKQSWLADHVNLLAIIVAILGVLVFVVVFVKK